MHVFLSLIYYIYRVAEYTHAQEILLVDDGNEDVDVGAELAGLQKVRLVRQALYAISPSINSVKK